MAPIMPVLDEIDTKRELVTAFGGYNHNLSISSGEFYDMKNMSSDLAPVLSPRKRRGRLRTLTKPNGLFAHNKLCWVDGTDMYYNGSVVGTVADSKKQFVAMGAYIIVWPDKVYYNTYTGEFGSLENETSTSSATATLCKADGTAYENITVSDSAPSNPTDGKLWIDTSETPHVLKQYSTVNSGWVGIPTVYVKIAAAGIGSGFSEHDGVTISGFTNDSLNGDFILYGAGDDFVVITAIIDASITETGTVTVKRSIPDMDFITESENRLWGCSSANHEIYACKQGDPKNWHCFMGIATDSYAATVGSGGDFTGCCAHNGFVMFFKDNAIHKIYGTKPANYQLSESNVRGVEAGSAGSLVVANEVLYYKARNGICALTSSLPEGISAAFGQTLYKNAVAGALGSKYYVCMEHISGVSHSLFVYDAEKGMWHKEDDVNVLFFASLGNELYFINGSDNGLYSVGGDISAYAAFGAALEPSVNWFCESGDIGLGDPNNKYISKIQLRVEVSPGSTLKIELKYDGIGEWEEKARLGFASKRAFTIPIIPRRCDTMRIRISGRGECRIYSVSKIIEKGSEL